MSGNGHTIRVVVLSHGGTWEAWEAESIRAILKLKFASLVLIVEDASSVSLQKTFFQRIATYQWNRLFWNRWFRKYGSIPANSAVELNHELQAIPVVKVKAERKGKYSDYFSTTDLEMIKSYQPDVIIRFGFNILRGEILTAAPHGVWSFHHADHETIRGGPAGFWEYCLGHNTTGAILQQLTEKLDEGVILRQGRFELIKHSFRENLNSLLFSTSGWIANALTELHLNGQIENKFQAGSSNRAPIYKYPGNFRMMLFWLILLRNKLFFHWENLFLPETWIVGIIDQNYSDVLQNGIRNTPQWIHAKSSAHYIADPFAYEVNGEKTILAEEYAYTTGRGRIVNLKTGKAVLEKEYHLSFPNPLQIDGKKYIVAEASVTGKLRAFSLDNNAHDRVLLDQPIVDPVLFAHDNLHWLFGHKLNEQNNSALFVYYSADVSGPFTPHPLNPVKTDIRNSRSAGPIIEHEGKILRPAQDSSKGYGSAVVINEVRTLSTTQYHEVALSRISPDKSWEYNRGLHTVSPLGNDQTLIDAKSFRFNFANFKAELARKFRRILK